MVNSSQASEKSVNQTQDKAASAKESNAPSPIDGVAWSLDSTSSGVTPSVNSITVKDLLPVIQKMKGTLERSRLIVDQEPIDNNEDLKGMAGESDDPCGDMEDLERTVRSAEFYTLYGDYMGRVWNCLELTSRDVDGFWPSGVVAVAEKLTQEEGFGGGEVSETLAGVLQRLEKRGLSVSSDVAKKAIFGYAKRNLICHGAPRRLNDKDTRNTIASHVAGLERLLPDDQKADHSHWTRLVKLWNERGSYLEDMRKSAPETSLSPVQDASRFLASPPQNAKEKEEFTQALETGLFQDELDLLSREGGPRRQDTPRRTRESTRSDPLDGVPSKRKMDLTPSPSSLRPLKRQK
ncbi:hypothetical protein N7537_006149 [Penicillium hordei]|uniref:Uncharacterized protein n=1 Tax=Penicillium hordei TaxID=40994 RepID=A0AAD6E715_9EURO|nr:uncharacterized protein N7537_006149 [Penicillium hordei]KAJ5603193.1 hypothetical protein N7537_006149 [Penicillium hordei]